MIYRLPIVSEEIDPKAPFEKCALGRQPYAEFLTEIIRNTPQGVISLNGAWGTGKTTFIRMWDAYLRKEGFKTLYFNVWDNDYSLDPMISLMAQLFEIFKKSQRKKEIKEVLGSFGKIAINVAKPIGKGILKRIVGTELDEVIEGLREASDLSIDELANLSEKAIDKLTKEKEDIIVFKKALENMVKLGTTENSASLNNNAIPIVCFIDELDRCNPQYSVRVLERIKHIFSVPGIVFVLAVDKKQFGNAIRGYYGSDLIDADEYLRRFIDLDLNLPFISSDSFFQYVYKVLKFKEIFTNRNDREIKSEEECFKSIGELIVERSNASLRQIEKMMIHVRLVLTSVPKNHYLYSTVTEILTYIRTVNRNIYDAIANHTYSVQELIVALESIFSSFFVIKKYNETPVRMFTFAISELVCMYNKDDYDHAIETILEISDKEDKLQISLQSIPTDTFIEALKWEKQRFRFGTPSIQSIIKKIELISRMA